MKFDKKEIRRLVDEKYITENRHPNYNIYVYKYTSKTVYERYWNDYTLNLRGTVLDRFSNLISIPFSKFFNYSEYPSLEFSDDTTYIYEKMDGALLNLFNYEGKWNFATQQRFVSEHTERAMKIFEGKYIKLMPILDPTKTYMFELISDVSHVIVNYEEEDLHLLGVRNNVTCEYDNFEYFNLRNMFSSAKILFKTKKPEEVNNFIANIDTILDENSEGVVIYQPTNDIRVKVKTQRYIELHKLLYVNNERAMFNSLIQNKNIVDETILKDIPDEWYNNIKTMQNRIKSEMDRIISEVSIYVTDNRDVIRYMLEKNKENRKLMAISIKDYKYKHVVFSLLDDKKDDELLFDIIKSEKKCFNEN